jgi:hypothetical protein
MATTAQYFALIGKERIVSFVNSAAPTPDPVPDNLDQPPPVGAMPNGPGTPQKGNRKVVVMVTSSSSSPEADDLILRLTVKVPAGILNNPKLQKFAADTPEPDYLPQVKLIAQSPDAAFCAAIPDIVGSDPVNQTVTAIIYNIAGPPKKKGAFIYLVELDWSHSTPN